MEMLDNILLVCMMTISAADTNHVYRWDTVPSRFVPLSYLYLFNSFVDLVCGYKTSAFRIIYARLGKNAPTGDD